MLFLFQKSCNNLALEKDMLKSVEENPVETNFEVFTESDGKWLNVRYSYIGIRFVGRKFLKTVKLGNSLT